MGDNLFGGIETKGRNMTYTNMEARRTTGAAQTEYDDFQPNQGGSSQGSTLTNQLGVVTQNPRSTGQAYRLVAATSLPLAAGVPHFSVPLVASVKHAAAASALTIADPISFSFQVPLLWSIKRGGAGTNSTWKVSTGRGDVCTAKASTTDNAVTFPVDINDSTQSDYLSDSTGLLTATTAADAVGNAQTFVLVSRVLMSDQPS